MPGPTEEVAAVRERFALPERYLVWVGGLQTPGPAQAGRRADPRAPGRCRWCSSGRPRSGRTSCPACTLTGAVSDDELAAIYTGAHALVFPSDDEGFGLPPVEALACGTPVAACDVPALREVLDGRATLSAVDDLDGLIAAAESAVRPAPPPPAWTWEDAAGATWQVYCEALAETGSCQIARPKHRAAALVKDA